MNDLNRVEIIGTLVDDPEMFDSEMRFQIVSWRQPTSSGENRFTAQPPQKK
jgi:hypothetical protein